MSETLLKVRDLKKSYGDHAVLRGVSYDIEQGKIVGLLGPNGADIREAVFRACAKADLPILEMHTEQASLEEIFLELTQGDGQEGAAQPPEEKNETPAEGGETA